MRAVRALAVLLPVVLPAAPVAAQQAATQTQQKQLEAEQSQQPDQRASARVADSAVGEVGQRQAAIPTGLTQLPFARIDSRIANRVQSRIRNRLDRYYDPQANATSPFVIAEDKARTAGKPGRR